MPLGVVAFGVVLRVREELPRGYAVDTPPLGLNREVVVSNGSTDSRHAETELLPEDPRRPGLSPSVARFFAQLDRA